MAKITLHTRNRQSQLPEATTFEQVNRHQLLRDAWQLMQRTPRCIKLSPTPTAKDPNAWRQTHAAGPAADRCGIA
jgi:hypothetical protein